MRRFYHCIWPTRASSNQHQITRHVSQSNNNHTKTWTSSVSDTCLTNPYHATNQLSQPRATLFGNSRRLTQFDTTKYGYSSRSMSQMPWQQPHGLHKVPKQTPVSVEETVDETVMVLLDKIYEADSAQGILDVYDQWKDKFNEVHTGRALWCLGEICGRDKAEVAMPDNDTTTLAKVPTRSEIVQMGGFKELSGRALRDSIHMDNKMFISSLEALCKLDIPHSSFLVQTLLEQSKSRLNTFDCNSLAHFAFVLDKLLHSTPLVNALLDGVSLRVPLVIGKATQIWEVVSFMKAVGKRLPKLHQAKLVNMWYAIMSVTEPGVDGTIQALGGLTGMACDTRQCCDLAAAYLRDNINDVQREDLVRIIITLSQLRYHNEELYDLIGGLIADHLRDESSTIEVDSVWNVNQLAHLCRVYARWKHLHPRLLDAIANSVTQPGIRQQHTMRDLAIMLQPFAKMRYAPPNNDMILDEIIKRFSSNFEEKDLWVVVEMAKNLVFCGRYPSEMVDYIVNQLPHVSLEGQKNSIMVSNLKKLHQALSIQQPHDLQNLEEIQRHIEHIPNMTRLSPNVDSTLHKQARSKVSKTLSQMCREQYSVTQDVNIGLGHNIDFVLDNGESRHAIVLRDASCYAVNIPHHALASTQIMEDHLLTMEYQVAWVVIEDFLKLLSEEEQQAYINNRVTIKHHEFCTE